MKEKTPAQNKPDTTRKIVMPTSAYWTLEREADGHLSLYQFSPFIEMITGFKADYFTEGIKQWLGVVHPEDRQNMFDFLSNLMDREGEGVIEYRVMRPDGLVRWVSDCATSVRLQDDVMRLDGAVSDITERKQAEEMLKRSNQQLAVWINELQERKSKMDLLESVSSALQPCNNLNEVYHVLIKYAEEIFPDQPGALYLYDIKSDTLQQSVKWGEFTGASSWEADTCHAWQSGKPHVSPGTNNRLLCKHDHNHAHDEMMYLCAPLVAQGERVGVLYLRRNVNDFSEGEQYDSVEFWKSMAMMITERLGFVILNLKLRSDLANQSVRDPLTGMYVRRYLEESIQREIPRSIRYKRSFGLILIDIDNLDAINETMGRAAGNAVLQSFGKFLLSQIRSSDVSSRLGGDEFMMLLPEASLEDTANRAELFRMEGKNIRVLFGGHHLKTVTLSIGVAAFPQHGDNVGELFEAVEKALAKAKAKGCDQMVIAAVPK
jgi:diguanylate cyclase (GGDEF)-like protein/PAS domain S-box-containing protein